MYEPPLYPVPRPNKYEPGEPITSIAEFQGLWREARAASQDLFVWDARPMRRRATKTRPERIVQGRPVHIGWAYSMPFGILTRLITGGNLRRAVVTRAYRDWLAVEAGALIGPEPEPWPHEPIEPEPEPAKPSSIARIQRLLAFGRS